MDRKHPGRPKSFSPSVTVEVKQLAGPSGIPLARWSCAGLAAEVVARGTVEEISRSTKG